MDDRTYVGAVSEAKAIWYFTKEGYDVFNQVSGKASCDLVVIKNNKLYRISVKGTTHKLASGNYEIQLKKVRSNKTENKIIKFDASECDLVFMYVVPEDRYAIKQASNLDGRSSITI